MGLFKGLKKLAKGDILGAAGSIAGAVFGHKGAKKAAKAQAKAAADTIAENRRQYDLTRADQMPWIQAGTGALNRLNAASNGDLTSFNLSPDYNFRRSEGTRGIEQTAAARGGAFSGNALKALAEFNSNLASGEYGNWWNRQAGLAGVGQDATNAVGSFGANSTNNIGNALMAAGDARASGIVGSTNAITGGLAGAINNYSYFRPPNRVNSLSDNYGYGRNAYGRAV